MKRLIFGSLSVLLLGAAAPAALAGQVVLRPEAQNQTSITVAEITPFDLVTRTYNGEFADQGLPGGSALISAYNYGRVDAEDLVKAGINQGRLTVDTLENQDYLNAVAFQLEAQETRD